jgi:hypothetical protein
MGRSTAMHMATELFIKPSGVISMTGYLLKDVNLYNFHLFFLLYISTSILFCINVRKHGKKTAMATIFACLSKEIIKYRININEIFI